MDEFDLDFDADYEDLAGVEESLAALDRSGGIEAAFRAVVREELESDGY
jgi:hypothetical protein